MDIDGQSDVQDPNMEVVCHISGHSLVACIPLHPLRPSIWWETSFQLSEMATVLGGHGKNVLPSADLT